MVTKKTTKATKTTVKKKSGAVSAHATKSVSKRRSNKNPWMILTGVFVAVVAVVAIAVGIATTVSKPADYIVETNAFFAPFEYYEGREIVGVDVDIVNRVAEKTGKKFDIKNVEFDVIIDNVEAGKIADAGAAGLTITPARAEKVNFTIPYYNSVQYVIFSEDTTPNIRDGHIVWDELAGKKVGSQTGSTGYLFLTDEADEGVLAGTDTIAKGFDSHQLAADAISAHIIDYAIADELAAQYIVSKNSALVALPLYYSGETMAEDYPVEESYAIAVNKERTELLEAFNEVLAEMLTKDENGVSEIDRLVMKHMGLED